MQIKQTNIFFMICFHYSYLIAKFWWDTILFSYAQFRNEEFFQICIYFLKESKKPQVDFENV